MKNFTKFISKLPFAGKMSIRFLLFSLYHATTLKERRVSYLKLAVFLILSIPLHAMQMKIGISVFEFNSPIWAKAVSALYAIANLCVVLTQIHLGYRATRFFFQNLSPRVKRSYTKHSRTETVIMLAVTWEGQIIFLSLYSWYR